MAQSRPDTFDRRALIAHLFLALVAVVFIYTALRFLPMLEFGDETEKMVGGRMIANGGILYGDVFAHHGPLPYIWAHAYALIWSETHWEKFRILNIFLAFAVVFSVYKSPLFQGAIWRCLAASVLLSVLIVYWPMNTMHMVMYQALGGFFFAIPLTQVLLPGLLGAGGRVGRIGSFASGFALACMFFLAYSFVASIFLVAVSVAALVYLGGLRLEHLRLGFAGFLLGVLAFVLWLVVYGDILGYVAYHFYLNQVIFSDFISYRPLMFVNGLNMAADESRLNHFPVPIFCLAFGALAVQGLRARRKACWWIALVSIFLSMAWLNPRGVISGYHAAGYFVAVMVLLSALSHHALSAVSDSGRGTLFACVLYTAVVALAVLFCARAVSSPHNLPRYKMYVVPFHPVPGPMQSVVMKESSPNDRFLAMIFTPHHYITTGLMPASGHYYYLPWQAAYNKKPFMGVKIDLCRDIERVAPRFIMYDAWRVWGEYDPADYEPCLPKVIAERYEKDSGVEYLYRRK